MEIVKKFLVGIAVSLMCLGSWAVASCGDEDDVALIHAAASLVDVMAEIEIEYERTSGNEIRLSYAGSNLIANQIVSGAPADGMIVAGETPIDRVVDVGLANPRDVVEVFGNRLVVVRKESEESAIQNLDELVGSGRIAMPNPETAPAGEYFETALTDMELYEQLEEQIVPTLDVRAALAAVVSGNVAYAFVYRTDAMSTDAVEIALEFEQGSRSTSPRYYAMPIDGDDRAADFIEFLASPAARRILDSHGFVD